MDDIDNEIKKIIERIKKERLRLNMSQAQLAAEAGIAQSFYSGIELGDSVPTLKTLIKISRSLKVHPSKFFIEEQKSKEQTKEHIIKLIRDYL